jgi:hypothetical protein
MKGMFINDVTCSGNVTSHFRYMELYISLCEMYVM